MARISTGCLARNSYADTSDWWRMYAGTSEMTKRRTATASWMIDWVAHKLPLRIQVGEIIYLSITRWAVGRWVASLQRSDGSNRHRHRQREQHHQRNEKISNKSSFGIIDIADSSISDRIIVIVETACFIHDGAYRWRSARHVNVSASHWLAPITRTCPPVEKAMRPRCSSNATSYGRSLPQWNDEMWWPSWVNACNR